MTFTHAVSTDNYGPAKWIVATSAANGTHTTLASAMASASAGDTIFIRPGTYTENVTLKNNVNIAGYDWSGGSGQTTSIVGKLIDNGVSIGVTITNINLQTNSDNIIALTGAASTVELFGCRLSLTNNTGLSIGTGCTVIVNSCSGDLGTTGIGLCTGAGSFQAMYSTITNSGGSSTASTSSGGIGLFSCTIAAPFSVTSSASIGVTNSALDSSATNTACVTTSGTGGLSTITNSALSSGTASSVSIGSGTAISIVNVKTTSSNANVLTGAGTLNYSFITFAGSSSGHNVTTENAYATLI